MFFEAIKSKSGIHSPDFNYTEGVLSLNDIHRKNLQEQFNTRISKNKKWFWLLFPLPIKVLLFHCLILRTNMFKQPDLSNKQKLQNTVKYDLAVVSTQENAFLLEVSF